METLEIQSLFKWCGDMIGFNELEIKSYSSINKEGKVEATVDIILHETLLFKEVRISDDIESAKKSCYINLLANICKYGLSAAYKDIEKITPI